MELESIENILSKWDMIWRQILCEKKSLEEIESTQDELESTLTHFENWHTWLAWYWVDSKSNRVDSTTKNREPIFAIWDWVDSKYFWIDSKRKWVESKRNQASSISEDKKNRKLCSINWESSRLINQLSRLEDHSSPF